MGIVPEMDVDNAQRSFFYLIDNGCEQFLCRSIPLVDKGGDVSLLNYERIVVW